MNLKRSIPHFILASCLFVPGFLTGQNIATLPSITGAAIDPANDKIPVLDASATDPKMRLATLAELVNVSSFTNGNFLAANSVEFSQVNGLQAAFNGKQATLVSGDNIKTVNNNSLIGSGNITIQAGTSVSNAELPALLNEQGLNATFNRFMDFDVDTDAAPANLTITGFGDSMVGSVGRYLMYDLAERYGLGSFFTPNLGFSHNGAAWAYSNGAGQNTTHVRMPAGIEINVPAGGVAKASFAVPSQQSIGFTGSGDYNEAKYSIGRNSMRMPYGITKVRVFFVKGTGVGTVDCKLVQSQVADVSVSGDAEAASSSLGFVDLVPTDAFAGFTLEITATSKTAVVLGAQFIGHRGVGFWSSARGSTYMGQMLPGLSGGQWNPVYAELFSRLNTALVFHAQRAADSANSEDVDAPANYTTFFRAYRSLQVGQVYFYEPSREPYSENPVTVDAMNASIKTIALAEGVAVFDRRALVREPSIFSIVNGIAPVFQAGITGLTGGGATNLDGIATGSLPLNTTVYSVTVAGTTRGYVLRSGAQSEFPPDFVRADDAIGTRYWEQIDGVHRWPREYRYTCGRFLHLVDFFRVAYSRFGTSVMDQVRIGRERFRLGALEEARVCRLRFGSGHVLDGVANTTWVAPTVTNERGVYFLGATSLGSSAARLGALHVSGGVVETSSNEMSFIGKGFRQLDMTRGSRAFILFGGSSTTVTTLVGLTQRCFGIEYAHGSDVGVLGANFICRQFWGTGSGISYGPWGYTNGSLGNPAPNGGGHAFWLHWNPSVQRMSLYCGSQGSALFPHSSVVMSVLASSNTASYWVHSGILADNRDDGNGAGAAPTPSASCQMEWREVSAIYGSNSWPFQP